MANVDFHSRLTPDQRARYAELRDLAATELAPLAPPSDSGRVDRRLMAKLGDLGILPALFPSHSGGSAPGEVSAVTLCLMREALAQGSTVAETAAALQGLGAYPILQSGSDDAREKWIPAVARGKAVAAFALTEPGAGSDAAALAVTAERDGGRYRLSGTKTWISNAPDADVYTLFARTTPDAGARGVTAFVVPGDAPGLSGESLDLLAPHAIGTLQLDGVLVEAANVLGKVDAGFAVAMKTLDLFRPSVGAFAVGMAQAALDAALVHVTSRRSFGHELREHQAVSQRLADMATRTAAARYLVYEAAFAVDSGERTTKLSAMAKLFATEAAQSVVDDAIQIHGASGLQKGHLLEHLYRDVRATRIYEGTSEIQREVITRELYR